MGLRLDLFLDDWLLYLILLLVLGFQKLVIDSIAEFTFDVRFDCFIFNPADAGWFIMNT